MFSGQRFAILAMFCLIIKNFRKIVKCKYYSHDFILNEFDIYRCFLHLMAFYTHYKIIWYNNLEHKKYYIPETKNLSTDADRRSNTILGRFSSRNDVHFLMYIFIFMPLMPLWRTAGTDVMVNYSLRADERPQKNYTKRGHINGNRDSIKELA